MSEQQPPIDTGDPETGYYYDVATGEVTQGPRRLWQHRMGPYATREQAERALETARQRTEAWDEEGD